MTNSEQNNVAVILTEEMAEQQFQQLNLKELGLQSSDLAEVLTATKELQDMNHQSVA